MTDGKEEGPRLGELRRLAALLAAFRRQGYVEVEGRFWNIPFSFRVNLTR